MRLIDQGLSYYGVVVEDELVEDELVDVLLEVEVEVEELLLVLLVLLELEVVELVELEVVDVANCVRSLFHVAVTPVVAC